MKCPKCGKENNENSRFCKSCGQQLNQKSSMLSENSKPIIITVIAIVAIILVGIGVYASGIFVPDVPLTTKDFDGLFKADVPEGSNFVVKDAVTTNPEKAAISYENKGKYSDELTLVIAGTSVEDYNRTDEKVKQIESNGNMTVYQYIESDSIGKCSIAIVDDGTNQFQAIGYDLNTVKRVAKSFQAEDMNQLKNNVTPLNSISQSGSTSSSGTPSSISILGGSFSTGSDDADKTYARINVGTQHAGENVIVQIYYSRDGNNLNNGNMVPATVHSDGYLEISSADAYKYYPDHATINIYDSNSKLLTSTSVNLSPTSGTQTF